MNDQTSQLQESLEADSLSTAKKDNKTMETQKVTNKHEINGCPVRFTYLEDWKEPRRVLTVARLKQGEDIHVSVSVCAPTDQFEKAKARAICEGRLVKHLETGKGDYAFSIKMQETGEQESETEALLELISERLPRTATSVIRTAKEGTFRNSPDPGFSFTY